MAQEDIKLPNSSESAEVQKKQRVKILIVDDEQSQRYLTSYMLSENEELKERYNLEIEFAENWQEALAKINSWDFDLVITDYEMPEMDWLNCVKWITNPNRPNIIMLSGSHQENLAEMAYKRAIDVFLQKPLDYELFIPLVINNIKEALYRRELKSRNMVSEQIIWLLAQKVIRQLSEIGKKHKKWVEITIFNSPYHEWLWAWGDFITCFEDKSWNIYISLWDVTWHNLETMVITTWVREKVLELLYLGFSELPDILLELNKLVYESQVPLIDPRSWEIVWKLNSTLVLVKIDLNEWCIKITNSASERIIKVGKIWNISEFESTTAPIWFFNQYLFANLFSNSINPQADSIDRWDIVFMATDWIMEVKVFPEQFIIDEKWSKVSKKFRDLVPNIIKENRHKPVQEIKQILLAEYLAQTWREDFDDDATFMIIKMRDDYKRIAYKMEEWNFYGTIWEIKKADFSCWWQVWEETQNKIKTAITFILSEALNLIIWTFIIEYKYCQDTDSVEVILTTTSEFTRNIIEWSELKRLVDSKALIKWDTQLILSFSNLK